MNPDIRWFSQHRDRNLHIRLPRAAEFATAWLMLGDHLAQRRRVLVCRLPDDHPMRAMTDGLLRIPFLQRADETIEDSDEILAPILDNLMREAAKATDHGGLRRVGMP